MDKARKAIPNRICCHSNSETITNTETEAFFLPEFDLNHLQDSIYTHVFSSSDTTVGFSEASWSGSTSLAKHDICGSL